jgi:hypothetical protein
MYLSEFVPWFDKNKPIKSKSPAGRGFLIDGALMRGLPGCLRALLLFKKP